MECRIWLPPKRRKSHSFLRAGSEEKLQSSKGWTFVDGHCEESFELGGGDLVVLSSLTYEVEDLFGGARICFSSGECLCSALRRT